MIVSPDRFKVIVLDKRKLSNTDVKLLIENPRCIISCNTGHNNR